MGILIVIVPIVITALTVLILGFILGTRLRKHWKMDERAKLGDTRQPDQLRILKFLLDGVMVMISFIIIALR